MRDARRLGFPDIVWSHFSRPRHGDFDARVAAAADAGMAGIGLYVHEYARLRRDEGRTTAEIRAVLDAGDVALADAEVTRGWWATAGAPAEECWTAEAIAYEMADEFGVRHLQAIGPYDCGFDQAVDGFGGLCDRAAAHGLLVGLEWLPFTNIATAADAQAIVREVGRPNAGYCVDIWHHTRGADDMAMIQALEPERVFCIQLNDGARVPLDEDYKADCLANRVVPGAGEFDIDGFLRTLIGMGVDAPISLEVCSTELWEAPAGDAARAAADALRTVLDRLGVQA